VEPAGAPLRLAALLDEAGALQHLEMLRDRRQAHVEGGRQLGDRRLSPGQASEDRAPGWIGESRERRAEGIRLLSLHCASWLINLGE
jgi:hypothetical protein